MATSPIYSWPEPDNTDLVKNGALAIRTLGNAIDTTMGTMVAKTVVDAKGDLIAGTAADTVNRLAVGNNGETLVADSSTSTGLRYTGNYAAGKNKIINGDFGVWQRGTSFSSPLSPSYTSDRWRTVFDGTGATRTISQQTFTPGTAPVSGYEGQFFYRIDQTVAGSGGTFIDARQRIEDVRSFAGQPVTISFWAKAAATQSISIVGDQDFGSGGSAKVFNAITGSTFNITTAWTRYTLSGNVASVSGKTIGTSSFFEFIIRINSSSTFTVDLWGVQVEYGSVATAFQTATGTIQGELAACQRYYWQSNADSSSAFGNLTSFSGVGSSATALQFAITTPVSMRIKPSSVSYSTIRVVDGTNALTTISAVTVSAVATAYQPVLDITLTGATQFRMYAISANNSTAAYIALSAEL